MAEYIAIIMIVTGSSILALAVIWDLLHDI